MTALCDQGHSCSRMNTNALACAHAGKGSNQGLGSLVRYRWEWGGPREGKGGAVADAMCAAAIGCRACAKAESFSKYAVKGGGGAHTEAHSGQSMLAKALSPSSSPLASTIFIKPPDAQIICMPSGLMMVEAIAEPKNKANHTNTSLAMSLDVRRFCMLAIMAKNKAFSKSPENSKLRPSI